MNKIGFGIVGCGVIGDFHASAISKVKEAELIAVANPTIEKAKKIAGKYNTDYYSDYKEILKRKDIDVVCICTPSGTHGEIAIDAANSGKHILIEKPMEVTLEKCDRIIEICKKNKVKLGVVFQSRTYTGVKKLKEIVDSGKLGKIVLGDLYNKWYRKPEYYTSAGWRATWKLDGGGALMNQGIHGIDLLQWIMGPVESVIGYSETLVHNIKVEDTAVALLKFKSGALGVIEGTTSVYPGFSTRIDINAEKGSIVLEDATIKKLEINENPPLSKRDTVEFLDEKRGGHSSPTDISDIGHMRQMEDMIKAIKEDTGPMISGEEARKSVEIILAIYKSSKQNSLVKLPL